MPLVSQQLSATGRIGPLPVSVTNQPLPVQNNVRFSPFMEHSSRILSDDVPMSVRSGQHDSPEPEQSQSKFEASFAKLESLENQARDMTQKIDQRVRGSWEPHSRPHALVKPVLGTAYSLTQANEIMLQNQMTTTKSSGTWQPSPPPPRISPSPKPEAQSASQKFAASVKASNKVPWEPSPPPITTRAGSPAKTVHTLRSTTATHASSQVGPALRIQNPVPISADTRHSVLVQEDFPALPSSTGHTETSRPATPMLPSATKKMWEPVKPVAAVTIAGDTPKSIQGRTRSRQNSNVEALLTPTRGQSPSASPLSSRASSPAPIFTPLLARAGSTLGAQPAISSPLANLNTGKQLRIVSSKSGDDAKIKAEQAAAEERTIKKVRDEEAAVAAAVKAMPRKSVPAASVKKSKEQKLAEQREKAEKRDRESVVSSQAEDSSVSVEIAPIMGRARKQKNKASGSKTTPIKKAPVAVTPLVSPPPPRPPQSPALPSLSPVPAKATLEQQQESVEIAKSEQEQEHEEISGQGNKVAAMDAIAQLAAEVDLRQYAFFKPIPSLTQDFGIQLEELALGQETTPLLPATQHTVEELELMLAQARKQANDHWKTLQKLQKRNMKLARLDFVL